VKEEEMKYRKKPEIIEAVHWTGKNEREVYDFLTQTKGQEIKTEGDNFYLDFQNGGCQPADIMLIDIDGNLRGRAIPGDVIIRDERGHYSMNHDIFEKYYEPLGE
jgi:hypothetical protein